MLVRRNHDRRGFRLSARLTRLAGLAGSSRLSRGSTIDLCKNKHEILFKNVIVLKNILWTMKKGLEDFADRGLLRHGLHTDAEAR